MTAISAGACSALIASESCAFARDVDQPYPRQNNVAGPPDIETVWRLRSQTFPAFDRGIHNAPTLNIYRTDLASNMPSERVIVRQYNTWTAPESSPYRGTVPWVDQSLEVSYQRDWTSHTSKTATGLDVTLTPFTGIGYRADGPRAEAGATLSIGRNIADMAQDGVATFGNQPRWYVFAAGSKRAVGYNLARGRDGALTRAGISHDPGSSLGDATIGVAYRQGIMESSLGVVYRELETDGLRGYGGLRTDVDEGILAFQFAIRPR